MNCLILGGGPSLLESLGGRICKQKGWCTIGVNLGFMLGGWVDVCFFMDALMWWNHKEALMQYKGRKISLDKTKEGVQSIAGHAKGVEIWNRSGGHGISVKPKLINQNVSSGGSAINVAYQLGAKKIILLGYDMHGDKDGWMRNWYPEQFQRARSQKGYATTLAPFPRIAEDAKRLNLTILNATPGSALKVFPRVDIEEVGCLT